MEYAQLTPDGIDAIQVTTHGNVEWDANNYCTAAQLTADGKAEQFRVVPLTVTEPPAYDEMTQTVVRDGCELVGGAWQYKWRVDALSAETIAANQAAAATAAREAAKAARTAAVEAIKVTTADGRVWDGDEVSQGRLARAIIALSTGLAPSVTWVLADNSVIQATAAELTEALVLAGQAQAAIWVIA
jgi:hypothetical protein